MRGYIAAACLSLLADSAGAETRALVVGVSGYPKLPERIRLTGPKNDSREVANTLARLGVPAANITVLADGVSGLDRGIANPGPGDKQAILDGLDRLAATSQKGDLAVFYFSGHGSQQSDREGDEEGNSDEIFLPYDVGSWGANGVENALVDDELSAKVGAILDKGIDFFGIIDACHSATGFRALDGDDTRSRNVDPADLGVPVFAETSKRGLIARRQIAGKEGRGRAAFFYAAQEDEEALEKSPKGAEKGESYGVFTYQMLSRLNQSSGLTYRTLNQAVVADIKRNTLMTTQTPELEGELLDEPVLRASQSVTLKQWPIFAGKLQGGALQGVSAGAVVALLDDPTAPQEKALGFGVVESVGATKSLVAPAAEPCAADQSSCAVAPDAATFKKARFARLVEPGVDFSLVVSEPVRVDPNDGHDYSDAIAALRGAVAGNALSARVSMRSQGYDIAVGLVDGTLAFSPAGGLIDGSSPRLTLPADAGGATAKVTEAVERMAKATALQRMGGGSDGLRSLGLATKVLVSKAKQLPVAGEACPEDEAAYEAPVAVGENPSFTDCDILSVAMDNKGGKALDVTVLLVGADFSIVPVWPVDGNANRILSEQSRQAEILQMEPHPKSATRERLVFLAVPGINRAHVAFTDLEQEGLRAAPGEDAPEVAAIRAFISNGLNSMDRTSAPKPERIAEDLSIEIKPFQVTKGDGG